MRQRVKNDREDTGNRAAPTVGERERAVATLRTQIKNRIGVTAEVAVLDPDSIERSVGKALGMVGLRPKQ